MEYRKLGNSDLNVSRICLGCMGFGDAMFCSRKQPDAERAEELKELEELDRQREAEGKA